MTGVKNNMTTSAGERIGDVAQQWFLHEPLLFSIYCTHEVTENSNIKVPLRTGGGRIEYNEKMLGEIADLELVDRLKVEALRILLKHPYIRQPYRARPEILYLASNMTILDNIGNPKKLHFELVPPNIVGRLPNGKTFEEYYGLLNRMLPPEADENTAGSEKDGEGDSEGENFSGSGGQNRQDSSQSDKTNSDDGGDNGQDSSDEQNQAGTNSPKPGSPRNQIKEILKNCANGAATWAEDSISADNINMLIESALNGPKSTWGTIKGDFIELVKASLVPPINVANLLKGFKKTILSHHRDLTRMRPSRRYGFEQMGSKYAYTTCVLVAIDTSGSVDSYMLTRMLGLVNRIFKQGIERIDVIQFDVEIQGKPMSIRKCIKEFKISGRGGTDFQPAADYYMEHSEYDGLIYITDGEAPNPRIPLPYKRLPVTWIITDDDLIPSIQYGWDIDDDDD